MQGCKPLDSEPEPTRTSDLGLPAGQHYVYPGVRSPLLLPTDYIRKYFSIYVYI